MKKFGLIALLSVLTLGVVACGNPSEPSEPEVPALPTAWAEGEAEFKKSSIALVPGEGQTAVKDYFTVPGIRFIDMRDVSEGYGVGHVQHFESISHFKVVAKLFDATTYAPLYAESVDILNELFPTDQTYFLMCQSGGRVATTIKIMKANGYDVNKIYNVGGWNDIKDKADFGGYSVSLGFAAPKDSYDYEIKNLTPAAKEAANLPAPWGAGEAEFKKSSVALVPGEGQVAVKDFLTTPGIRFVDMRDVSEGYGVGHVQRFESVSHFKVVAKLFDATTYAPLYEESVDILNELFPTDQTYFLMCQSGGRVATTIKIMIANGYDASKLYNVGGWNDIKDKADFGGYSVSLGFAAPKDSYDYEIKNLTPVTAA